MRRMDPVLVWQLRTDSESAQQQPAQGMMLSGSCRRILEIACMPFCGRSYLSTRAGLQKVIVGPWTVFQLCSVQLLLAWPEGLEKYLIDRHNILSPVLMLAAALATLACDLVVTICC